MMRLSVTRSELENGFCVQTGARMRILDLMVLAGRREPVAVTPVSLHDHRTVGVVRLIEDATDAVGRGTSVTIKFRPVWCKLFTVFSMKKDDLLAALLECEHGKFWIDKEGVREATLSTSGPGCDPAVVRESELALFHMIADEQHMHSEVRHNIIDFIKKSF